jgi:HSP20 family molecular chaperone IbpA
VRADLKRATRPRAFNPLAVFNEWLATCIAVASKEKRNNMSKVIIEKPETASEMSVLNDEANTINGRIRERAFELFEKSGEARGNDSENWIRAEEEVLQIPQSKIGEQDGSIVLHVTIEGHHEQPLKVIAMPDALIVSAEPKHRHSKNHLAAIGAKRIFQRFNLPDSIDAGSVHATLENGLLKITAKLAQPKVNTAGTHA